MQDPANILAEQARRLTALCIAQGSVTGDPADGISSIYASLHGALKQLGDQYGDEVTLTTAELAGAALQAGLVYPGKEATALIATVGARVQAAHRGR